LLNSFNCDVISIETLPQSVYRVMIRPPTGVSGGFCAGQYLGIKVSDKEDPSFFSIASAPADNQCIELHIHVDPNYNSADKIIHLMQTAGTINVSLPYGKACLSDLPQRPQILMVAGTGFAQAKSIIEYLLNAGFQQAISLYWGVRKSEELYLKSLPEAWQKKYSNFQFIPLAGDVEDNQWPGHHEQLYRTVIAKEDELKNCDVYASGSPGMVYAALDALREAGLPETQFFSDVLEYAPQN
jgi:CDP-4-dehydro-6-deoxyglucose reductase